MRAPTDPGTQGPAWGSEATATGHRGIPDHDGHSRGVEGDTLLEVGRGTHRRELCRSVEQENSVGMDFSLVKPQTCDC